MSAFKGQRLFIGYDDGYHDFGEIFDVETSSEDQLRQAVCNWTRQCLEGHFYVLKQEGGFNLIEVAYDFQIRDASGKVIEEH